MAQADEMLDEVFGALSNAVRRGIVARLSHGPANVTELQNEYDISLPAISRHLRVLESAGLIKRKSEGRFRNCELRPQNMNKAVSWIETRVEFWEQSLDALATYLEEQDR